MVSISQLYNIEVTPPAHPAAHHPGHRMLVNSLFPNPAAGSYKFSFDTTTKFLTGPAALLTNLVTILNRDSPSGSRSNCVAPTVVGSSDVVAPSSVVITGSGQLKVKFSLHSYLTP